MKKQLYIKNENGFCFSVFIILTISFYFFIRKSCFFCFRFCSYSWKLKKFKRMFLVKLRVFLNQSLNELIFFGYFSENLNLIRKFFSVLSKKIRKKITQKRIFRNFFLNDIFFGNKDFFFPIFFSENFDFGKTSQNSKVNFKKEFSRYSSFSFQSSYLF